MEKQENELKGSLKDYTSCLKLNILVVVISHQKDKLKEAIETDPCMYSCCGVREVQLAIILYNCLVN